MGMPETMVCRIFMVNLVSWAPSSAFDLLHSALHPKARDLEKTTRRGLALARSCQTLSLVSDLNVAEACTMMSSTGVNKDSFDNGVATC